MVIPTYVARSMLHKPRYLLDDPLKMELKQTKGKDNEEEDDDKNHTPRILAVTHSNGAADVLLQALLQMNVPAVRAGRPASVSPLVQVS